MSGSSQCHRHHALEHANKIFTKSADLEKLLSSFDIYPYNIFLADGRELAYYLMWLVQI